MSYIKLNDLLNIYDAILLSSPHNLRYFTGFKGGEGYALIGKGFRYLFVDSRYTVAAKLEADDFEVIEFSGGKLYDAIYERINENGVYSIGFENSNMSVLEYEKFTRLNKSADFIGLGNELSTLRMIKTAEEIQTIRKAEQIGVLAFEKILPRIRVGVSECEIAAELEYQMRLLGAEGTSFDTIVVSGEKSSMPHGKPDGKKFNKGDFVTIDFGCIYNGYCSDMTRTVVIEGASDEHIKIYDTVMSAQLAGLSTIRAGVDGKTVDKAARDIIDNAGYGKYFGHSLGHGVGLLVHELPNLSPLSDIVLQKDMVVSCEPGIYIEGFGGVRIEDLVVINEDGCENLTNLPKDLIICG